jgi:mycothiol synthase
MSLELRAPTLDEVAALTSFANRVSDELYGEQEETEDTVRQWLTAPEIDPETDARIALSGGQIRGYADLTAHPDPRYWADLRVPLSESDDVRTAIFVWLEARARERAEGKQNALLRFFGWSVDEPEKRLLERSGYRLIRHSYRMRIDFEDESPEPQWPVGIQVRKVTDADLEAVYETHQETFEDSWEHTRDSREEWEHWLRSEGFDPTLWFLAEEDGEPAGVSLCRLLETEPGLGWVSVLGVRRPWRRRGLGRALLLHSFRELQGRGCHAVGLGVDAESLTGAHRLYEQAGMRVVRRGDIYEKELRAGTV